MGYSPQTAIRYLDLTTRTKGSVDFAAGLISGNDGGSSVMRYRNGHVILRTAWADGSHWQYDFDCVTNRIARIESPIKGTAFDFVDGKMVILAKDGVYIDGVRDPSTPEVPDYIGKRWSYAPGVGFAWLAYAQSPLMLYRI